LEENANQEGRPKLERKSSKAEMEEIQRKRAEIAEKRRTLEVHKLILYIYSSNVTDEMFRKEEKV
jgi:hypothetical protein